MEKGGLVEAVQKVGVTSGHWLGCGDEMRIGLMSQVRRVWAPVGVKVVQKIAMAREWRYLALVVNPSLGKLVWSWTPNMKKEAVAEQVKEWHKAGVQAVVWDRSGGHRSLHVRDVAQQLGVKLVQQPPYAPELNPAERVFEELRRAVEGPLYADLNAKVAAVETALLQLAADPQRVKSLTAWRWIQQAYDALPSSNTAFL